MEKVKAYTASGGRLDEFSMVFYNNLLSLPLIAALMCWQGEWSILTRQPDLYNPAFLIVASLTGLVAFGISFSVLWFLSSTTATTFSLVVRPDSAFGAFEDRLQHVLLIVATS